MNNLAEQVLSAARRRGVRLATAESCTGGLIAGALTDVAGSSDVFDRGFVTYSNVAKTEMLGVSPNLLTQHGAVSEPVAAAMAAGARERSQAHYTISVTGIAGPGGGSAEKPLGLVYIGLASNEGVEVRRHEFEIQNNVRRGVREQTIAAALLWLYDTLSGRP